MVLSLIFMGLAVRARVHELDPLGIHGSYMDARIIYSCYAIWFYMIKTVLPTNITAYYPALEPMELLRLPFLLGLLGTLIMSAGVFLLRRRWPGLLAAWLSYLVILAPNLG